MSVDTTNCQRGGAPGHSEPSARVSKRMDRLELMDHERATEVEALHRQAKARGGLRASLRRPTRRYIDKLGVFCPGKFHLGFSTPAALADAIYRDILQNIDLGAQDGPVRHIFQARLKSHRPKPGVGP